MSKREKRVFSMFLLCASVFLFVSPYFILPRIYAGTANWIDTAPPNATILELWEIDTFEGGSASRAKFLERRAYAFQKETFSAYILVRQLSLTQAKIMLSSGTKPDMISFGIGAGELVKPFCFELETDFSLRADLMQCGLVDGLLAVPWCVGGYCLCAGCDYEEPSLAKSSSIGVGLASNVPMLAIENSALKAGYTQFEAYEAFLRGDFEVLLGTQRDFYRLNRKVESGVTGPVKFEFLEGYTDLEQVISVCTQENKTVCEAFIQFLLAPVSQSKLCDIGLFSVLNIPIYDNDYKDFETSMLKPKKTLNVFTTKTNIDSMQQGMGNGD